MKKSFLNKIVGLFFLLVLWYLLSKAFNPIILPSPFEVANSMINSFKNLTIFPNLGITVLRAFLGLIFSFIIGFPLGIFMGINKTFYETIRPLVTFIQSMPVISWVLLALIWLDNKLIPLFVVVAAVIPIIILNIAEGIKRVDKKLLQMADIYNFSKIKILKNIYIPSVAGYFESSLKIVLGNSFKVVVMAEVLSHPGMGIGEKMSWARINIETADLLAWSIIVVLITFFFMGLMNLFLRSKSDKSK